MRLTRASEMGSPQATRRLIPGSPLIALAASAGVSNSRSTAAPSPGHRAGESHGVRGRDEHVGTLPEHGGARVSGGGQDALGRARQSRSVPGSALAVATDCRRCDPASGWMWVSDSVTRASAMPSAMQWCIRQMIAVPLPKPSTM